MIAAAVVLKALGALGLVVVVGGWAWVTFLEANAPDDEER